MQTIIYKATFDNNTKFSAVIAKEDELYSSLQQQCAILFQIEDQCQISYMSQGIKVILNSNEDILIARTTLNQSILEFLVERKEEKNEEIAVQYNQQWEEEILNQVTAPLFEEPREQASDCESVKIYPELINLQERDQKQRGAELRKREKEFKRSEKLVAKQVKLQERLLKKQQRIEQKQIKKQEKVQAIQDKKLLKKKEQQTNKSSVTKNVEEVTYFNEQTQQFELKIQNLKLEEQLQIEQVKEKFKLKQAKLLEKQESVRRKLILKRIESNYPSSVKNVYIQGDQLLKTKPFKSLMKLGRLNQAQGVLVAMNSAFDLKMQSATPGHKVSITFDENCADPDQSAVDMIAVANEVKNVMPLDSCLFVCAGHEFKQLKKLGALVVKPEIWSKILISVSSQQQ